MKEKEDGSLTTRQAAELLEVDARTIQNWVEKGVLQAWKTVGGHRRISRASVEVFLRRRRDLVSAVDGEEKQERREMPLKVVVVEDEAALRAVYDTCCGTWDRPVQLFLAVNRVEGVLCMVNTNRL